jgi:Ca2+-binding EF-hand superfamily protein
MGQLLTTEYKLAYVFEPFQEISPSDVFTLMTRLIAHNSHSFGFQASKEDFLQAFTPDPLNARGQAANAISTTLNKLRLNLTGVWSAISGATGHLDGSCSILHLFAGLVILSKGEFDEKVDALFDLFDFDGEGVLSKEHLHSLISFTLAGMCKMVTPKHKPSDAPKRLTINTKQRAPSSKDSFGSVAPKKKPATTRKATMKRSAVMSVAGHSSNTSAPFFEVPIVGPTEKQVKIITRSVFLEMQGGIFRNSTLSPDELLSFARSSAETIDILCKFSTIDADKIKRLAKRRTQKLETNNAARVQAHTFASSGDRKRHGGKIKSGQGGADGSSMMSRMLNKEGHIDYNRFHFKNKSTERDIKHLKTLFDSMDVNSTGLIPSAMLVKPHKMTDSYLMRDVSFVFQTLEVGKCAPHITFSEMLGILYNGASPEHMKTLLDWVPPVVERGYIRLMQQVFDQVSYWVECHVYV